MPPYVVYGGKYINLVAPALFPGFKLQQSWLTHLDLSRAPYVLYGVHYIDLVSLAPFL